jgi:hypothetical protein
LHRNCLLSQIIDGEIIGTRRRGSRPKQLLDDLKEARRYWKLEEHQFSSFDPIINVTYYMTVLHIVKNMGKET